MNRLSLPDVQSAYYVLTGIWPILSIGTFMRVTGPKKDIWLVKMVGALAAVIGLTMAAGRGRPGDPVIGTLRAGSTAAFAAIDFIYAARGRISPIYAADGVLELVFLGDCLRQSRRRIKRAAA